MTRYSGAVFGSVLALGLLDQQILTPLVAALARGLGVEVPDIGFAVAAYAVAAALTQLVIGPLSDARGRRVWLLGAVFVMFCSALAIAGLPGYAPFVAARIGAGMAGGTISALTVAWVADITPYANRGRVMAILLGGAMGIAALGQVVGAQAAARSGHRIIWVTLAFAALVVFVLLRRMSEAPPKPTGESLGERFRGYAGFLGTPDLRAVVFSAFFASGSTVGIMTYASGWMQESRGFSLEEMGALYGGFGIVILLTQPIAGRIADRFGKRRATVISSLLIAGMTFALPMAGNTGLVLLVFGFGSVSVARLSAFAALRTGMVPGSRRAAFLAFSNTLSQMGIAAGAGVGGLLYPLGFPTVSVAMAAFAGLSGLLLIRVPEPGA